MAVEIITHTISQDQSRQKMNADVHTLCIIWKATSDGAQMNQKYLIEGDSFSSFANESLSVVFTTNKDAHPAKMLEGLF